MGEQVKGLSIQGTVLGEGWCKQPRSISQLFLLDACEEVLYLIIFCYCVRFLHLWFPYWLHIGVIKVSFKSNNNFHAGSPSQISKRSPPVSLRGGTGGRRPGPANRGLRLGVAPLACAGEVILHPPVVTDLTATDTSLMSKRNERVMVPTKGSFETCRERDICFPLSRLNN